MKRCRDLLTMSKEEPPHNKRRKEASPSLDSLPDPVAISCLAGLSRSDHAALSLVSKSCRSLVVSPELYQTRSLMGHMEKYLYICLTMPPDQTPRWFILWKNRAHAIPSIPSQPPEESTVVVVDWGIYVIGGLVNGKRTSAVLLLDCRSHKWHHVTSMKVARASAAASVVDGKIYVFGGCWYYDKKNWGEVFDPKTQTWEPLPMLEEEDLNTDIIASLIHHSVVVEGKVYSVDSWNRSSFYYLPSQCKWGRRNHVSHKTLKTDWCVIDNLLYSCGHDGRIYWCEAEELNRCDDVDMDWRAVDGFQIQILQERLCASRLVHFGRDMDKAIVWKSFINRNKIKKTF